MQTKKGCIPVREEFNKLKDAKAELFKIATYDSGCWLTKDGFECEIVKK